MNGHDAFGICKSYVPGSGYKSAKALSDVERHIVRNKALGNSAAFKAKGSPAKNAPSSKGRRIYEGQETQRGKLTRVVASRSQTGKPQVEGFSQPDGRGGGRVVIHDDADFKTTAKHEMAHITPKRNPVRFYERVKDETRLGREEGRADYIAHGKQSTGSYPGSSQFKRGYDEVQGKMAQSAFLKEKRKQWGF